MADTMRDALRELVPEPGTDEIDAALQSVERRARRAHRGRVLAATAVLGAAAVSGGVLAALAGDDGPDVSTEEPAASTTSTSTAPPTAPTALGDPNQTLAEVRDYLDGFPDQDLLRSTGLIDGADGAPVVLVELRADATQLAEDVRARWGTAVLIHLGFRNYPEGTPTETPAAPYCPEIESGDPIPGLEARLELDDGGVVASGADLGGRLVLTNTTDREISLVSGTVADGYVVAPGGASVLGISTQGRALVAVTYTVPPGGSKEVPVAVGTTACQPDGPPGLPAGEYEVYLRMTSEGDGPGSQGVAGVAARAPLTIE